MGWPTCTGLRSGLSRAQPQAEIMPPERHLCPCSGYAGFFGFFARRTSAPKKVDCVQIDPHCQHLWPPFSHISCLFSILFTATSDYLPITREGSGPPSGSHHVDITRCANMFPL